jgi:hypothetical protein
VLPDAIDVIRNSWQRLLKGKTPLEVFMGEDDGTIRERLRNEAESRRNTRLYTKRTFQPGDKVRLSLRVSGDSKVQSMIKQGIYKSSRQQWSDKIYEVDRARGYYYKIKGLDGQFDPADLLLVPDGKADPYPRDAAQADAPPVSRERRRAAPAVVEQRVTRSQRGISRRKSDDPNFVRFENDL